MRLDGKRAIIIGAGSGIGAATAAVFSELGAQCLLIGPDAAPLKEVAERTGCEFFVGDASSRNDMAAALRQLHERYGKANILVNCAGGGGNAPLGELSDAEWGKALATNFDTARVSTQTFLDDLTETKGSIVFVSSLAGIRAVAGATGYISAKHAVLGLMKAVAVDYGPHGVRVNAICPGFIRTPMGDGIMDHFGEKNGIDREAMYQRATSSYPLRRPGMPEEIARAIAFLAGDWASFITGQALVADGGGSIVDVF